jgi:hypothetical protein
VSDQKYGIPPARFTWPDWRCVALDVEKLDVCNRPATWHKKPVERACVSWTYCERHKPKGAEPITPDIPFAVTRLELRVAVTGAPGDLKEAADEAVRRVLNAIAAVGGLVTEVNVRRRKASTLPAGEPVPRLTLGGRVDPPVNAIASYATLEPSPMRFRRSRRRNG